MSNEIPVEVQEPCQPKTARLIGFAPDNLSEDELLRRFGLTDCLEAKVIRSKKRGDRWSVVR